MMIDSRVNKVELFVHFVHLVIRIMETRVEDILAASAHCSSEHLRCMTGTTLNFSFIYVKIKNSLKGVISIVWSLD